MRFAVVGAGAIGGYLAARLSLADHEVVCIARNQNLQALQDHGVILRLPDGSEQRAPKIKAVQHLHDAGVQDVVLLTLKAHQLSEVIASLPALLGPQTLVVSMLNGIPWWYFQQWQGPHAGYVLDSVDPAGRIAASIAPERIIGSVVYPACSLVAPGVVQVIEGNRFTLGEPSGLKTERITALAQAFMQAGFKAPISTDIRSELWLKLWGNLSFNPISALTHATLFDVCSFPATRRVADQMMQEAQAVAEKLGVTFKVSREQRINGAQAVGAHKTSMLQDVEQGRALELGALVGSVCELGRLTHTPTPTIDTVHALTALLSQTLSQQHARLGLQHAIH
jgi:2-dehydropantoate 2-reductase